jgi:hypothetical protein
MSTLYWLDRAAEWVRAAYVVKHHLEVPPPSQPPKTTTTTTTTTNKTQSMDRGPPGEAYSRSVKKFRTFHGIRRFITIFTEPRYPTDSYTLQPSPHFHTLFVYDAFIILRIF